MEEKELKEDWCREISPGLAVFNRAFIRRAGKGLFPYVLLDGNKEAAEYCARKEALLFYQSGVYENDEVNTDIRNGRRGVFLVERYNANEKQIYLSLSSNGSLIFFNGGNPDHANRYDVSGCDVVSFREAFIPMIGMECEDGVIDEVLKKYPSVWNMDIMEIVNNTTLCHYSQSDDDLLRLEDFDWLSGKPVGDISDGHPDSKADATEAAIPAGNPVKVNTEQKIVDDRRPEARSTAADKERVADKVRPEAETSDKSSSDPVKDKPVVAVENEAALDPAKNKDKDDGLSIADKENNKKLRDAMVTEYKEVKELISKESVPGMFNPVKRVIDESIETLDFSESPTKKYIEVSKDFSTDLYKRLYGQTEPLRRKFESDVKRKFKKLTCFNCHHEWDEDVTFAEGETCMTTCPKCGTQVGYEP